MTTLSQFISEHKTEYYKWVTKQSYKQLYKYVSTDIPDTVEDILQNEFFYQKTKGNKNL